VRIDPVFEPSISIGTSARLGADIQGAAVWENDPLPDDKQPRLTVLDVRRLRANEPRTLRDQKLGAGGVIKNILSYLGNDGAWHFRIDARK